MTARAKARSSPAVPDRRAMTAFLAALGDHGGDRHRAEHPTAKAQHVIYDAWEQRTKQSRVALAHEALRLSLLCADAYVILAKETARSAEERRDLFARGVEAGELAPGPDGFEECAGFFWGFLDTRPTMRARAGLANALLTLGDTDGAIAQCARSGRCCATPR